MSATPHATHPSESEFIRTQLQKYDQMALMGVFSQSAKAVADTLEMRKDILEEVYEGIKAQEAKLKELSLIGKSGESSELKKKIDKEISDYFREHPNFMSELESNLATNDEYKGLSKQAALAKMVFGDALDEKRQAVFAHHQLKAIAEEAKVNELLVPFEPPKAQEKIEAAASGGAALVAIAKACVMDIDAGKFHSWAVASDHKEDFEHDKGQVAIAGAPIEGVEMVLDTIALVQLITRKNKSAEDYQNIGLKGSMLADKAARSPKEVMEMINSLHGHVSNGAMHVAEGFSKIALPIGVGLSVISFAFSAYRLYQATQASKEESRKQDQTLDKIITDIDKLPLPNDPADMIDLAENKELLAQVLRSEVNQKDIDKMTDADQKQKYQAVYNRVQLFKQEMPEKYREHKLDMLGHHYNQALLDRKQNNAKRALFLSGATVVLSTIALAFPPSAIVIMPVLAVVGLASFLYKKFVTEKQDKHAMEKIEEAMKEAEKAEANNAPTPSTPNPSTPNPSTLNPSTPNPSTPNPSTPNPSAPNPSAPNPSATKDNKAPEQEAPKSEVPKPEAPKVVSEEDKHLQEIIIKRQQHQPLNQNDMKFAISHAAELERMLGSKSSGKPAARSPSDPKLQQGALRHDAEPNDDEDREGESPHF